ncbi:MAG: hypothetical protein ACFE7S_03415 [Candidatus Hodarchaeota archaeon]
MRGGSTRGLVSQIAIGISGIITVGTFLYLSSLIYYPVGYGAGIFYLVSLFGFYLTGYHDFVPLHQVFDFLIPDTQFAYLMEVFLPSFVRILNSAIFLLSVLLLLNSLTKIRLRSDENRTSALRPRFMLAAFLGLANTVMIISIISGVISLTLIGYSFEHWTDIPFSWPAYHYELLSFGWILIVLEDVFGAIAMLLIAALFIANRKIVNAGRPWLSKGMTYTGVVYTIAGVFAFTIHLAFVGVIMVIIAGITGAIVFVGIKSAESLGVENTETSRISA